MTRRCREAGGREESRGGGLVCSLREVLPIDSLEGDILVVECLHHVEDIAKGAAAEALDAPEVVDALCLVHVLR